MREQINVPPTIDKLHQNPPRSYYGVLRSWTLCPWCNKFLKPANGVAQMPRISPGKLRERRVQVKKGDNQKANLRWRCLAQRCSLVARAAAPVLEVIALGRAHHTILPQWFSMREYTNNLRRVGYIVAAYHTVGSGTAPPPGWTIATWAGRTYHLHPDADKGFIWGGPAYSLVVLDNVLILTPLPDQA